MMVIGSTALLGRFPGLERRPKDVDLIGTNEEVQSFISRLQGVREARPFGGGKKYLAVTAERIYEFEIAWPDTAAEELVSLVSQDSGRGLLHVQGVDCLLPSVDVLYALKLSHRYLKDSPHFLKTMRDIQFLRSQGAEIPERYADWFKRRERETYDYSHPKLNVRKADFFRGDGVKYIYDHDDIHQAVAHYVQEDDTIFGGGHQIPAYRLYMKDGAEIQCSREKFFALDEEDIRLWGVLEEAYVLALERSQIPYRGKVDPKWSFDTALMKVCTSITSGWFREYAWEHYDEVQELYNPNYVDRFWRAVENGQVRPHRGSDQSMK